MSTSATVADSNARIRALLLAGLHGLFGRNSGLNPYGCIPHRLRRASVSVVDGYYGVRVAPWKSLQTAHDLACIVVEHSRVGAALVSYCDKDVDEANRLFADGCYLGGWESTADYAQDLTEQTTEIPGHLAMYIDYQAMARDMELNGDIFTIEIDSETHIFMTI